MKRLAWIEFLRGLIATVSTLFLLFWGFWWLPIACGVCWMLGGTFNKAIRRYLVPILVFLAMGVPNLYHYIALSVGILILHIGDGYPDYRVSTWDEGSDLGQWVAHTFDLSNETGGELTKWLIVLIFQLSLVPYFLAK